MNACIKKQNWQQSKRRLLTWCYLRLGRAHADRQGRDPRRGGAGGERLSGRQALSGQGGAADQRPHAGRTAASGAAARSS